MQKEIAVKVKSELQELIKKGKIPGYQNKDVVTHIADATTFYPAHEEHQEYLDKNPNGYCNHGYRYSKLHLLKYYFWRFLFCSLILDSLNGHKFKFPRSKL